MITSLRGRQPEAIPYLLGYSQYQPSTFLVVAGIASSRSASALLAMTWGDEMKSLDEESAKILKAIKGLL